PTRDCQRRAQERAAGEGCRRPGRARQTARNYRLNRPYPRTATPAPVAEKPQKSGKTWVPAPETGHSVHGLAWAFCTGEVQKQGFREWRVLCIDNRWYDVGRALSTSPKRLSPRKEAV